MEESIRIVDLTGFRSSEAKSKTPVPKVLLDLIGDSETLEEIDSVIEFIESSKDLEDLCQRKSAHLARIRKKIIIYEQENTHEQKEDNLQDCD